MQSSADRATVGPADPAEIARRKILMVARRKFLHGWKRSGGEIHPEAHDELWGPIPHEIYPFLLRMSRFSDPLAVTPKLVRFLESIRNLPPEEAMAFRRKLRLGRFAHDYLRFIQEALKHYWALNEAGKVLSPDDARRERKFGMLLQQHIKTADDADISPLTAPDISGRNIIVVQTHSGLRGVVSTAIGRANLPISLVGNGQRRALGPEDFHLVTEQEGTLAFGFAKLGKLLRKSPRIVRIFCDGGKGAGKSQVEVFGKTLTIGMGGAALAHFAPSVLFFAATRWEDGKLKADFIRGPLIDPSLPRQRVEDMFAGFCADGVKHVLLGAPEDMGCASGFWSQLRQNL